VALRPRLLPGVPLSGITVELVRGRSRGAHGTRMPRGGRSGSHFGWAAGLSTRALGPCPPAPPPEDAAVLAAIHAVTESVGYHAAYSRRNRASRLAPTRASLHTLTRSLPYSRIGTLRGPTRPDNFHNSLQGGPVILILDTPRASHPPDCHGHPVGRG
jgi:hypothetical protein